MLASAVCFGPFWNQRCLFPFQDALRIFYKATRSGRAVRGRSVYKQDRLWPHGRDLTEAAPPPPTHALCHSAACSHAVAPRSDDGRYLTLIVFPSVMELSLIVNHD